MPGRARGLLKCSRRQFRAPVIPHPVWDERGGSYLCKGRVGKPWIEVARQDLGRKITVCLYLAVVLSSKLPVAEFSCVEERARLYPLREAQLLLCLAAMQAVPIPRMRGK